MKGTWLITTASSLYTVDLDAQTLVRSPREEYAGELRKDGEPIDIVQIGRVTLGEPMVMILDIRKDGVLTIRETTPVTALQEMRVQ